VVLGVSILRQPDRWSEAQNFDRRLVAVAVIVPGGNEVLPGGTFLRPDFKNGLGSACSRTATSTGRRTTKPFVWNS
jgi:hypothetical protein